MEQPKLTSEQITFLYEHLTRDYLVFEEIFRRYNEKRAARFQKIADATDGTASIIMEVLSAVLGDITSKELLVLTHQYKIVSGILQSLHTAYNSTTGKNSELLKKKMLADQNFKDSMDRMISNHPLLKKIAL